MESTTPVCPSEVLLAHGVRGRSDLGRGPVAMKEGESRSMEKGIKYRRFARSTRSARGGEGPAWRARPHREGWATKGVEFAGYYGHEARAVRRMLDTNGLVCCGTHTQMADLADDKLAATLEFNKTLGNKYGHLSPGWSRRRPIRRRRGWDMPSGSNVLAEKLKPQGMWIGYHAHQHDFDDIGGTTPWDIIASNTGRTSSMQLDLGNCMDGAAIRSNNLKRYPGRAITIHLKEHSATNKKAMIGEGDGEVGRGLQARPDPGHDPVVHHRGRERCRPAAPGRGDLAEQPEEAAEPEKHISPIRTRASKREIGGLGTLHSSYRSYRVFFLTPAPRSCNSYRRARQSPPGRSR